MFVMTIPSVASGVAPAYGQWSNSSSNNNSKKTNTIKLGPDLSDTIFEGDELQGKKAPGEKVDVWYLGGGSIQMRARDVSNSNARFKLFVLVFYYN